MENKVLILSASFGHGHKVVSKSIKDFLLSYDNEIRVQTDDLLEIIMPNLYKSIYKGYELLIKNDQKLYNYFYYNKNEDEDYFNNLLYSFYMSKLADHIFKHKPKLIISTFPLCSGFVSKFKEKYGSSIPLVTCITDVVDSWEWIYKNTDMYLVSTEEIKDNIKLKGVEEDRIKVTGIPVRKEFLIGMKDRITMNRFNISENDFVLLMMGGGIGLLPEAESFYRWLNSLYNVKTIIITGNNKDFYNKLNSIKGLKNVNVLGYTKDVAQLMSISNVLITKAGGVTVFEAINSQLPMIVYKPVLGQEIENCKFIEEYNIGKASTNIKELKDNIMTLLKNRKYLKEMKSNMTNIKKSIDTRNLANHILELYNDSNILIKKIS